jgi:hypothetical protein
MNQVNVETDRAVVNANSVVVNGAEKVRRLFDEDERAQIRATLSPGLVLRPRVSSRAVKAAQVVTILGDLVFVRRGTKGDGLSYETLYKTFEWDARPNLDRRGGLFLSPACAAEYSAMRAEWRRRGLPVVAFPALDALAF